MKPTKTLLIIVVIIVVLLLLAWLINSSNKKKTAAVANNQTPANPAITGRHIAVASNTTDYTEIVNGKPKWLWSGNNNCVSGYTKITSGINAGWCVLSSEVNKTMPPPRSLGQGKQWCCAEFDTNGNCKTWEQRDLGTPCSSTL